MLKTKNKKNRNHIFLDATQTDEHKVHPFTTSNLHKFTFYFLKFSHEKRNIGKMLNCNFSTMAKLW